MNTQQIRDQIEAQRRADIERAEDELSAARTAADEAETEFFAGLCPAETVRNAKEAIEIAELKHKRAERQAAEPIDEAAVTALASAAVAHAAFDAQLEPLKDKAAKAYRLLVELQSAVQTIEGNNRRAAIEVQRLTERLGVRGGGVHPRMDAERQINQHLGALGLPREHARWLQPEAPREGTVLRIAVQADRAAAADLAEARAERIQWLHGQIEELSRRHPDGSAVRDLQHELAQMTGPDAA